MKIRTNSNPDPKNKKKSATLTLKRGKETRTYTPESTETGDASYGTPGKGTKVAKILDHARKHKQDVVQHNGLTYRAGRTTVTKEPDKVSVEVPGHDLKTRKIKLAPLSTSKKGTPASEIRKKGVKKTATANPVSWVKGQGGGKGKSEGKNLGKKAKMKIRYQ